MLNRTLMVGAAVAFWAAIGVSAANAGGPGTTCGTRGAQSCDAGLYCKLDSTCGHTDRGGVCAAKPQMCTMQYAPVCGCDGRTYSNACAAASAGMSVASTGACRPAPTVCGTRGAPRCGAGQYCSFPAGQCGATDRGGTCKAQPRVCTKEYRPVCGCNNVTYGNACTAAAAGVSIRYQGACRPAPGTEGAACGSRGMAQCGRGLYCQYPDNARCGATDHGGTCQKSGPRPCTREYRPVCGCNNRTYSNRCVAYSAGTSVKYMGRCRGSAR